MQCVFPKVTAKRACDVDPGSVFLTAADEGQKLYIKVNYSQQNEVQHFGLPYEPDSTVPPHLVRFQGGETVLDLGKSFVLELQLDSPMVPVADTVPQDFGGVLVIGDQLFFRAYGPEEDRLVPVRVEIPSGELTTGAPPDGPRMAIAGWKLKLLVPDELASTWEISVGELLKQLQEDALKQLEEKMPQSAKIIKKYSQI